ncbi:MAG: hypothetical protein J5687_00955 [Treponema sp.]|nr:hypothetical protein [Treponema sp.]
MKKLNLILCACAIAVMGLSVSCKNDLAERKDVSYKSYEYVYTVSGTITTHTVYYECNPAGDVTSNDTFDETNTIDSATAVISWSDSKVVSTNGTEYEVEITKAKGKTKDVAKDKDGNELYNAENEYENENQDLTFYKIGKKFYMQTSSGYSEPIDADFPKGKDFTLSFTVTTKTNNDNSFIPKDSKEEDSTTSTVTYNLSFKAK